MGLQPESLKLMAPTKKARQAPVASRHVRRPLSGIQHHGMDSRSHGNGNACVDAPWVERSPTGALRARRGRRCDGSWLEITGVIMRRERLCPGLCCAAILVLLIGMLVACVGAGGSGSSSPGQAGATPPAPTEEVNVLSEYAYKLSSATKRLLSQAPPAANPELSFLIRIDGDLTDARRGQLKPLVREIRSVAGDIVTVTAPLKAVSRIAALDFVRYLDASGPLYLEGKPPAP
jgi:hypothetical protein